MDVDTRTIIRWVGAALTLAGGLVHLKLWDGIKDWPNDNLARMFLLNVVASVVAAIAVAVWDHWIPVIGALGRRQRHTARVRHQPHRHRRAVHDVEGLGKFTEAGFDPSPEALLALVSEIGAAAALVYVLAFTPLPRQIGRSLAEPTCERFARESRRKHSGGTALGWIRG